MTELIVLAEHRRGELRDITFEMLAKGRGLADSEGLELAVILFGFETEEFQETLRAYSDRVLVYNHKELADFNAECYQQLLSWLIEERKPKLTLIGHTSWGIDLAPALAVTLDRPLAPDCIDLRIEGNRVFVTRQVYGGKLNVEASIRESDSYIVTVRPATFEAGEPGSRKGEVVSLDYPSTLTVEKKRFVDYVEPPPGEVDISDAEIIVSIGRGVKDEKNLNIIQDLA
ncbi:MAG: electron transfer flavoprotein subunit alpha/FixB family protein, partial [Candidatus Bathyarchaeota archaeon]